MQAPTQNRFRWLDLTLFLGTMALTYLTFIKESSLYQNEAHNWRKLIYLLGVHAYYPATLILLAILCLVKWRRRRQYSPFLGAACVLFLVNFGLCAANNVLNFIQGRPIHSMHKGIGW